MTIEQAIRILAPGTSAEALAEIAYYAGFRGEETVAKTLDDACILAVAALRAQEERKWIPVTERLPERTMPPHDVLVYHDLNCGMFIDRAWYSHEKNKWRSAVGMSLKVTHWMPLPEPPKEVS